MKGWRDFSLVNCFGGRKFGEFTVQPIMNNTKKATVKPVYSGHLGTSLKCPDFPGQFTCKWVLWDHYQVS